MEENKQKNLDAGYLADNELGCNLLFSEALFKRNTAASKSLSWISEFCTHKGIFSTHFLGNEFFCVIDKDFLEDEFNYEELHEHIPFIKYAICTILDLRLPSIIHYDR